MQTLRILPFFAATLLACRSTPSGDPKPSRTGDTVHVEGYGVSIALVPPFKAVRLPPRHRVVSDQLVFAQEGAGRVRNMNVIPHPHSSGPVRLVPGREASEYVVGPNGTVVALGIGMSDASGVAVIASGPDQSSWTVRVGGKSVAWPESMRLESTAEPPGYRFAPAEP